MSHNRIGQSLLWKGRASNPANDNQYWYQFVEISDLSALNEPKKNADFALLGYSCDDGVRRNSGRIGASNGPNALRSELAKLSYHHRKKRIVDFGNIGQVQNSMEQNQNELAEAITNILQRGIFPMIIGGGHDLAFANYVGISEFLKDNEHSKLGIVNFDAHFDLRPIEDLPHSGTPFNQILSETIDKIAYLVLGIQEQSNTIELFEIAKKFEVDYLLNYDCELVNFKIVKEKLNTVINQVDYIYVTIDLDGFSSAYAPGVSAPSPMGFTPFFVLKSLEYLFNSEKVISLDIAELNPTYDRDNATAKLAARIVDFAVGQKNVPNK